MKFLKKCAVCGRRRFKFMFEQGDKNLKLPGNFKMFKCLSCNVLFLNPQPNFKELQDYYPKKDYYSLNSLDKTSLKVRLKLLLYPLFFHHKKNNYLLKFIFSPLKFLIKGTKIHPGEKILDIGCGSGQFLYEMNSLGLKTWGIEPGKFDLEGAKKEGLKINNQDLKKSKYKSNFFDIITMHHVLEHLDNPKKNIKEIRRILKKNGLLIIGVPNNKSLAYKLFGKNWYQLDIPRHLINYSGKNLQYLLEKNGFKILKIRFNSRPNQFSVSLQYLLNKKNKLLGLFIYILTLPLTYFINFLKKGDQIEIYCAKI